MTTAFSVQPAPAPSGASPAATLAIVLVAFVASMALVTAGITFASLAVAFPLAVPVAEYFDVAYTAFDAAIAEQIAGFWWAFAALAVASFGAALLVVLATIRALSPADRS
jgi:hypothetical protein